MMPFGTPVPSAAELDAALDDAAIGELTTDNGFNSPIQEILVRTLRRRAVDEQEAADAHRMRDEMESKQGPIADTE